MQNRVSFGGSKTLKVGGKKTIDGFFLTFKVNMAAVNTPYTGGDLLFNIMKIHARKRRGSKTVHTYFNGFLNQIAVYSAMFDKRMYAHFLAVRVQNPYLITAPALAVKGVYVFTIFVYTGPINIQPDESVDLYLEIPNPSFTANIDGSTSYVDVDERDYFGLALGDYETKFIPIDAGSTQWSETPGNNVVGMAFINFDQSWSGGASPTGNQVIQTLDFSTKGVHRTYDDISLLNAYIDPAGFALGVQTPYINFNCLMIVRNKPTDVPCEEVEASFTLNGGIVTATNNYIVVTKLVTTPEQLEYNAVKSEEHAVENAYKTGINLADVKMQGMALLGGR